jgi:hypothetical protein
MAHSIQWISTRHFLGLAIVASLLLGGCARIAINKVPVPDETGEWGVGDKKRAAKMEGLRFYRPRPYLAVKKAFPVGGDDFFVVGKVDDAGALVTVDAKSIPPDLSSHFKLGGKGEAALPLSAVKVNLPKTHGGAGDGAPSDNAGDRKKSDPAPGEEEEPEQPANTKKIKSEATIITGGDPASSPKLEVNEYFDLIYLPDFNEQYAIKVKAGIGSATADVGLENGWMLERSNITMDNSAIGHFIFSNIEKFIDIAVDVAKAAINPAGALASGALGAGHEIPTAQADAKAMKETLGGKNVLLRVRYFLEAQPGLYPILKPWEKVIDDAKHPDRVGSAKERSKYVHLPYRPYTVVAFNVRNSVVIEIVNVNPAKPEAKPRAKTPTDTGAKDKLPATRPGEAGKPAKTIGEKALLGMLQDKISPKEENLKEENLKEAKAKETSKGEKTTDGDFYNEITVTISSTAKTDGDKEGVADVVKRHFLGAWGGTTFTVVHEE